MILLCDNTVDDISALNEIAKLTLGEGYVTAESILENPISINARITRIADFCAGLTNDPICTEIVGYGTACIDYPSILGTEKKTLASMYPEKTGIICNVCTNPNFQKRGVGTTIVKDMVEQLRNLAKKTPISKIVASAWRSNTGINIGPIFDKLGFKQVTEIHNFYTGCACIQCDPDQKGLDCVCPAVIYEMNL